MGDPAAGGQVADRRFVERELGGKVKAVEIAQVSEVGRF